MTAPAATDKPDAYWRALANLVDAYAATLKRHAPRLMARGVRREQMLEVHHAATLARDAMHLLADSIAAAIPEPSSSEGSDRD